MPILSRDYGQTGDEWVQIDYGQHVYDYFFKGDKQALDYTNKSAQFSHQEYYGGLFDFSTNIIYHWFPSIPLLSIRHFFNALLGASMMIFTGLLARRLTYKWSVGVIALLFIIFSPRIFGESMNNPKDIPFAAGFIIAMYGLVALLQQYPVKIWKNATFIALGWGLAFGVRSAGGILLLAYMGLFTVLYFIFNKSSYQSLKADPKRNRLYLALGVAIVVGYIIGLAAWPWGLQSPISNPLESLKGMTNRQSYIRVLFEGAYYMNVNLPKYYEFKWLFISNPLIILAGALIFIPLSLMSGIKTYGKFAISLVLFGALFPILYMIYKNSTVYDTWRHIFFVYPFWVIAGAMGWDLAGNYIKELKWKWIPAAVAIAGLLPAMIWTVRSHPNQYVYFNELQGGVKGAVGIYDLDYYQNTGKQAADWIIENAKHIPGKKVKVATNFSGFEKYFVKDTSWVESMYMRYPERHTKDWDYYVTYGRYISAEQLQNGNWPPANIAHKIEIDGAILSAVIQRKSKASIAANEALQKKDLVTAAKYYEEYLATDKTDENVYVNYGICLANINRLDEAINALNNAIRIDPSKPDVYQILAQVYQAKGDMQAAQQAMISAQSIILAEQERNPQEDN